jgi:hypothetical protein
MDSFCQGIIFPGVIFYLCFSATFKFDKIYFMKQVKLFLAAALPVCFVMTNSCSQTTVPDSSPVHGIFTASTPCDDVSKALLKIPPGTKCELMKWNLTLYQDPKTSAPLAYKLICKYGLPKQGTRDFMEALKQ